MSCLITLESRETAQVRIGLQSPLKKHRHKHFLQWFRLVVIVTEHACDYDSKRILRLSSYRLLVPDSCEGSLLATITTI